MTPSMTAWPPTRISSSLELSAHDVAVNTRCLRYLKIKAVSLALRSFPVLSLESFDAAGGIDQFLFAGKEGMAFRADFKMDFRLRRAGLKGFAACASDDRVDVVRMYVCFHRASSNALLYIVLAYALTVFVPSVLETTSNVATPCKAHPCAVISPTFIL